MEENHGNALQQTTLGFGGNSNDICNSNIAANNGNPHFVHRTLSQWICCPQTPQNYVEFLAESGASEIQKEMSYGNFCTASSFRPTEASVDMAGDNVYPYALQLHLETPISSEVRCLRPPNELVPSKNLTGPEHHFPSQKIIECCNHEAPGFPPKPHRNASKQRAVNADRLRRLKIAERLDALQELLPHLKEGGKASILDDTIDHIKYLKFQIKNLSQSRLGGESSCTPFIFLEGYGRYLLEDQMLNEPLEEMMGKLLEVNPFAATQLLESRGLFMMPMALAEELDPHA